MCPVRNGYFAVITSSNLTPCKGATLWRAPLLSCTLAKWIHVVLKCLIGTVSAGCPAQTFAPWMQTGHMQRTSCRQPLCLMLGAVWHCGREDEVLYHGHRLKDRVMVLTGAPTYQSDG